MFRAVTLTLLLALLAPALAHAGGDDVIRDCTSNGALTKKYSDRDYKRALSDLPADVDEYGDCRQIIREAQLAGARERGSATGVAGGGGGGGGLGGSTGASGTSAFRAGGSPASSGNAGGSSASSPGGGAGSGSGGAGAEPYLSPGAAKPGTLPPGASSADERRALAEAARDGVPVRVGTSELSPGASTLARDLTSALPAPLLVALAVLMLAGLGAACIWVRRIVQRLTGRGGATA